MIARRPPSRRNSADNARRLEPPLTVETGKESRHTRAQKGHPGRGCTLPVKKPEPLHTTKEAAEILNASEKTVRRLIKKRLLRAIKIGGLLRVAPADLEDLIRDHRSH
jgi:excisionase family DNA binding protein